MEISKALELLKKYLGELEHLRTPPYNNNDLERWKNKIDIIVEEAFSKNSDEYEYLHPSGMRVTSFPMFPTEEEKQKEKQRYYLSELSQYETGIQKILDKHEILGIETKPVTMAGSPPKAFIAHGGDSPALIKLKSFLGALGVEPLVVEEQPSEGRSVGENVDWYARQADCAIILATKGDIDGKTGRFIPRGNVLIEIGKLQELFKDRIIYLLQAGAKLPTNINEKVRARFTSQNMDNAFIKIAKELKKFGILRAVKPQPKEQNLDQTI